MRRDLPRRLAAALLAAVAFALLPTACRQLPPPPEPAASGGQSPVFDNRLAHAGASLGLPPGWGFLPGRDPGEASRTLFGFRSPDGRTDGFLRMYRLPDGLDAAGVYPFVLAELRSAGTPLPEQESRSPLERWFSQVRTPGGEVRQNTCYPGEGAIFVLSVRLQGDATEAEREESRWISAQFQPADPRISVRSGTGGVSFHGCESGWVWMGDCRGGFYACSLDGTAPLIAGIWESDGKTAEELASGLGGTNLPPFAVELTVANRKVGARGTGRLEADGTCRLFLLFGLEGRSWCLHLATRGVKGEQEALDLVRSAGVQAFLRDCLLFDAGKEELI